MEGRKAGEGGSHRAVRNDNWSIPKRCSETEKYIAFEFAMLHLPRVLNNQDYPTCTNLQ